MNRIRVNLNECDRLQVPGVVIQVIAPRGSHLH
eukprot:COSAG03_NODE_1090_length_4844_cov_5.008851_2_plen_33_part_00